MLRLQLLSLNIIFINQFRQYLISYCLSHWNVISIHWYNRALLHYNRLFYYCFIRVWDLKNHIFIKMTWTLYNLISVIKIDVFWNIFIDIIIDVMCVESIQNRFYRIKLVIKLLITIFIFLLFDVINFSDKEVIVELVDVQPILDINLENCEDIFALIHKLFDLNNNLLDKSFNVNVRWFWLCDCYYLLQILFHYSILRHSKDA